MTKRTKSNTPPKHVLTPMGRAGSSFSDSDYGQSVGPMQRGPIGPASETNIGPASAPNTPDGMAPNMAY
jgi:hypothetical protein